MLVARYNRESMKKFHRLLIIASFIFLVLGLVTISFNMMLASEQSQAAGMPGVEREEAFKRGDFWAFKTADKIFGWDMLKPDPNAIQKIKVIQNDIRKISITGFLLILVSILFGIFGILKRKKFYNKENSPN